jgi:hypothetical protein
MTEPKSKKGGARQPAKPKPSSTRQDSLDDEDRDADSVEGNKRTIIKPYGEKIGESEDNLRGRGDWYRRRTGGA